MVSHSKTKWTIDNENSEIIFKEKYHFLADCNKANGAWELNSSGESMMYVQSGEVQKKVNYNLVVFEEKRAGEFWKRKTFTGLLILNDHNLNVLITLNKKRHDFNINGEASATYSVKGKLNKFHSGVNSTELQAKENVMLKSVIIFEGEIKLVQDEQFNI